MSDVTKIIVSGFSCSGSSAIVDWAREFDGCHMLPGEFDFFRHPDGVMDLRDALTERITLRRCYMAMERFDRFISIMARPPKRQFGRDLEALTYPGFEAHMRAFLRGLVAVDYPAEEVATWVQKHAELTPFGNLDDATPGLLSALARRAQGAAQQSRGAAALVRSALHLLGHPVPTNAVRMYQPRILTTLEFNEVARRYFDEMADRIGPGDKTHLLLDQAVSPVDMPTGLDLMSNARAVVIYRDPRDVFMSGLNRDWIPTDTAESFAAWFRVAMPVMEIDDPRVMVVSFEDLFADPDRSFGAIAAFLGLDLAKRGAQGRFFDPAASSENVGRWRQHPNQTLIAEVALRCQPNLDAMHRNATQLS